MKQKAKVTRPTEALTSRADAQTALESYSKAEAKLKKIEATIEEKCQKVREQYTLDIEDHQSKMKQQFDLLQDFAEHNPDEFKDSRSIDLAHGTIGFRTGKHQLKTKKGFTWDAVINLMKVKAKTFLRTKIEVDKQALINNREDKKVVKLMDSIGVEVVQEESFYVDTKSEELVES